MRSKIVLILLITTLSVSAQQTGLSIEPIIGLGSSEAVQNGNNNLGWKAGCGLVYMFDKNWGISCGLQMQHYSTKVASGKDSVYVSYSPVQPSYWDALYINTTYQFTYIELPVTVRYISSYNDGIGFNILGEAGFVLGYLIKSNESGTRNNTQFDTTKNNPFFNPDTYWTGYEQSSSTSLGNITPKASPFNFKAHVALGVFVPLSKKCSLIIDFSIDKGFINVGNSSRDYINYNGPFYYYKSNNNYSYSVSNYGTNFSEIVSARLNIRLENKEVKHIQ